MPVRELDRLVCDLRCELASGADDNCANCVSRMCTRERRKEWEAKGGEAGRREAKGWAFARHVGRDGMGRGARQGGEKVAAGVGSGPSRATSEGKGREGKGG